VLRILEHLSCGQRHWMMNPFMLRAMSERRSDARRFQGGQHVNVRTLRTRTGSRGRLERAGAESREPKEDESEHMPFGTWGDELHGILITKAENEIWVTR
jgi:hypothetical protein